MEFFKEKINIFNFKKKATKRFLICAFLFLFLFILFVGFFPHTVSAADAPKPEKCSILKDFGRCLILPFFGFATWLLTLSGTVFAYMIDTKNVALILNGNGTSNPIYEVWTYIRDLLNMAFIMVLLFSAFCTIFQIEQYNYKKTLWKIVLMALLVNFSFPITRFIIDASNILMYSIINSGLFTSTGSTATSALANIASTSDLGAMLASKNFPDNASLIAATIMILMLAITFLAIGVLLLIRVIVLAVLIIFSPIAFTGSIVPGLTSHANKWWETLLKYSLFGPTIILGVAIAIKVMNGIGKALGGNAINAAGTQVSQDANFVGYIAFLLLPIVLLWTVLSVAQKMGIAGAGAIMGAAQGAMKFAAKSPLMAATGMGKIGKAALKSSGVSGGVKQKLDQLKKTGPVFGSDAREKREARMAEKGPLSVKGAVNEHARKKANEKRDEWKKTGPPPKKELQEMLNNKDTDNITARAAALELAESTGFDGNYADYERALAVNAGDASGTEMLNEKTKKKGRDLILAHKINQKTDKDGNPNTATLQSELTKLDNADFSSINFENLIANTTNRGHDRGGETAVKSFFKDIKPDRKTQISRRINPDNEKYLENNQLFTAKEKEEPKVGSLEWANKEFEKLTKKPEQGSENTKKV